MLGVGGKGMNKGSAVHVWCFTPYALLELKYPMFGLFHSRRNAG